MNELQLKNIERPFTEIFSLLKHYECTCCGAIETGYSSDDLKVIHQHTDNAITTLLRGLQEITLLMGVIQFDKPKYFAEFNHITLLISNISNLTLALNTLRLDVNYNLSEQEPDNNNYRRTNNANCLKLNVTENLWITN